MKLKLLLLFPLFWLGSMLTVSAQPDLSQIVTIQYDGVALEYALEDLEREYDLRFTYSRDFIPLTQKVSVFVVNEPLSAALDELFAYTQVIYLQIGNQIALKIDENKDLSLLFEVEEKRRQQQQDDILISRYPVIPEQDAQITLAETPVSEKDTTQIVAVEAPKDTANDTTNSTPIVFEPPRNNESESADQTLSDVLFSKDYDFSNGVTGLVNVSSEDVSGLQFAAFANAHEGEIYGIQAAGLANVNLNYVNGVQVAGLFNRAERMQGFQVATLGNVAGDDFQGIQLSTLFNINDAKTAGAQITSFFNYSRDTVKAQLSNGINIGNRSVGIQFGAVNIAKKVETAQIGGINIGGAVDGIQFGLINIADTVSGAPIGLLNFIKKGYNRIEFAYQPNGLNANLAIKLGTHSFYNILTAGIAVKDPFNRPNASDPVDAWGLGYGIGTTIPFGKSRWQSNIEVTGMHINEGEFWFSDFNLLTQAKLTLDFRIGRRTSLFVGPQLNAMFSDVFDAENMTGGSTIAHASFVNDTNLETQRTTQLWWSWSAGIRF